MAIGYRRLNAVTIDNKFPLPNIDGILNKLGKIQYFIILDLAKEFHQIVMNPSDIKTSRDIGSWRFGYNGFVFIL